MKSNTSSLTHALFASALGTVALGAFAALLSITYGASTAASSAQAEVEQATVESETLRKLAMQAVSSKDARARLTNLAIPAGGNAGYLGVVEGLGAKAHANASVSDVSAAPPVGLKPGTLGLSVHFAGTYAECIRFLEFLETEPVALTISNLSLQHEGPNAWSGTLALSVLSYDSP